MKKTPQLKKTIFYLIFVFLTIFYLNTAIALDTTSIKYLPLKVGNIWVYSGSSATIPCHGTSWYDRYKITGTTILNGKNYFILQHTIVFITGSCCWSSRLFGSGVIRIDSVSSNIYNNAFCNTSNEKLVDSLSCNLGDTAWQCGFPNGTMIYCTDTAAYSVFGRMISSKVLTFGGGWDYFETQRYAKDIGLVSYEYHCGGSYIIGLQGCVIDGILNGDTSMPVGIQNVGSEVPDNFSLSQNYPNPFNPVTKIKFSLPSPSKGGVKLIVFDVLGREIAVLINEQLSPGTYEAEWDGSKYSSGVYFYKLITADYTETRKMVLVK